MESQSDSNSGNSQTTEAIDKLKSEQPGLIPYAEIVGVWVWVTPPSKPEQEVRDWLKANGYRWNHKRRTWQNPCGYRRPGSPKSTAELKWQFGAQSIRDLETEAA